MAYLTKQQRHNKILEIAKKLTVKEGISAITARRIATKGNFAIGQVHHHFQSVSQLKALALIEVTKDLVANFKQNISNNNTLEQIVYLISPPEGEICTIMRKLWNESVFLADKDNEIQQAHKQSLETWHKEIIQLLEQAKKEELLSHALDTQETAWKLLVFSCGVDNIAIIEDFRLTPENIKKCIYNILKINA